VVYDSGGYDARSVAIADVNGDGTPDLIVANRCPANSGCTKSTDSDVSVLLGNGDGTFQTKAVVYPTGAFEGRGVAIGDFNGDDKPDIAVTSLCLTTNCTSGAVSILLGNGDGTFKAAVTYGTGGISAFNVVVADMNGDTKADLVVANRCTLLNCPSGGTVGVLLGNGDGTFQAAASYVTSGLYAQALAVGDVDGDGKLDVVVVDQCQLSGLCARTRQSLC
jgi:hypothetical protein